MSLRSHVFGDRVIRVVSNAVLVMLVLALLSPDTRAQNGSMRVTVPSPTAASLGKFGDVPVSLYTGTPEISVPLFTAKGRTLELPIALKYHAGGIRVEEIGSWLGLGWTLEAGGAITRTVRGLVDESASGYFNTGHHFWTQGNWPNPPPELLRQIRDGYVDGDPDQFFFSFAGRSGQFVMGHTSASVREFRPIPYQKLRIEPSPSFEQWVITTEDGTKYTFSARETSTDWSTLSPATELGSHVGETHTSTWHLSEIRSPGGDVITLYYSPYSATHRQGSYLERFTNVVTNPPGGEACVPSSTSATNEYNMGLQRLDSIKTAAHTVKFSAATLRLDARSPTGAQQEPRLDRITVTTPTGAVLRVFRFDHDYFPGNRLRLNNVFEEDRNGVALPPTSFTYDPQTLPPRTSFSQDHWGYYNGKSNSTLIPTIIGPGGVVYPGADRTPDPAFMRMASLTRITYPTGGYSEFVYEANDYGGVGASGTPPVTEGPEQQQSALSQMGDGPVSETFTVGGTRPTNVTVEVSQSPSGCMPSDWDPCPYTELVGYGVWRDNRILSVTLAPGTYTITASDEFNPSGIARIIVTWRDQGVDGATSAGKTGGGLRVAEIRTADAMGNVTVRKYRYRLQSDTARSSGVVSLEPRYAYQFNSSACSYFARGSVSKLPLGDGPPVGYREVTVWHGASGEYGKTRHGFRSVLDAADPAPSGSWLLAPRTSYEWKRGQEREVTERNAAGQIQQSVASTFAFRDEDGEPQTTREFRGMSVHYVAGSCDLCTSVYAYSDFKVISAWTYQDTDTSVVYDTTGTSSFSTVRTYVHGNPTHGQLTEVTETNSDGSQRITRSKYPADFATGSGNDEAIALTAMQGVAHIHSPVIERWVTQRVDGTDSVVQAEAMTFKTFAPGQYLPYQRFVLSSAAAVTNFVPSSVSAGAFTKDSRYLLQESANGYDGYGRITQVGDARGKLTNYEHGGNPNNAFLTKVTRVKDSGGVTDLVTDLAYDSLGFLQSIKDEGGSFRYFTYDLFGRLRHIKNHGGTVLKAFGYVYSRTSPTWTFNSASPNAVVDTTFLQLTPLKSVVSTQFLDGLGRVIQTVVQDGASFVVTASQYDAMGRPWRAWKPYTRTTAGYDASFATNVTSFYNSYHAASDAKPYVETQYRPDALDRVSKVIPEYIGASPAAVTRHSYGIDPAAKQMIVEVADALDKKTRSFSDVFGNQVKTIRGFGAPEATTTLFASNIVGQRVKATDPRGLNTTYTLDTRGLITAKTSPDAGTVLYKHDKNGNLRYTQDANDVAFGHVNFTNYDFANRPLISGEGPWSFGSLDPDAEPLPALETNTNAWLVVRAYDAKPSTAAFPWSFFSPEISPLTLTNVSGRLAAVASKSNGAWQATMFSYDADGRVATRHTFTQGNGGGPVLAAVNTQVNYVRDLRDAVTERWLTVGASTFNQWYDYDNRGLLWKVFASTGSGKPATPDVTFTYRPSGQVQDRQFQGGPLIPMRYTIHEQLEKIGDPVVTTYPFSARYAYHANGTVSESEFYSAGSPATQKRYKYVFGLSAYDVIDRLKSADFSGWNGSSWTSTLAHDLANIAYDPSGNLTALQRYRETETLIDNLTYTYPRSSNQLSSVSDAVGSTVENWDAETGSFTYDANGNLLTAPAPYAITAVTYDHRNLPLSLTGNGVTSSYRYDDGGQRITKQVAGRNTEVYVLNGTSILGVITVNGSGTPVSWYFNVLAGDRVIGRQPSVGNRKYYHTDLLGSTRAVVEGTAIVESYDPEPWGLHMPGRTLGTGTKELFTGKERDAESALDYFGARLYMPAVARWSSVDPLADRAPAWSSYAYVFNNPLSAIDPTGRQTIVLKGADAQEFFDDLKKDQQRRQRGARRSQEPSATTGDAASRGVAEVFPCGRSFLGSCEERAALRTEAIKVLLEASKQALKDLLASAFGEMDCGEGVYCGAPPLVGPIGGGRHAGNLIRGVDHGAPSSANAARLRNALTLREAASVFTKSGGLHADVIRNSTRIIDGTALRNPDVVRQLTKDGSNIADWGKYVSDWYKSPAGEFQVHYYYNRATGVVNTTIDYKAVFK